MSGASHGSKTWVRVYPCLSTMFKIKDLNYSITSACSTSAHCIGVGVDNSVW